jgi:hypothetical protein
MSGHLRSFVAAFILLASLPTSASSNPLADLFNVSPPQQAPEPVPAEQESQCLPRPGTSTADGQRWVYRSEGRRKCWFQTAAGTAPVKQVRDRRAAKARVAVAEENEVPQRKRKAVMDARAELLRPVPAETSRSSRPAPEFNVAAAAPVPATGAAAFVPPPPAESFATDRLTSEPTTAEPTTAEPPTADHAAPRRLDEKTLLAAATVPSDAVVVSVRPAAAVASPISEAADDGGSWMATWLGVLLMALGLAFVLRFSRTGRATLSLRD